MLKLLLGRAGTGKSTALFQAMAEEGKRRPQLLIVPEQHSHDAERRLCALAGNAASLHTEVLSFTRLASRVFSVAGGLAEPTMDAGGRLLLMDVALKQVQEHLKVYARPSRKPQFLSQLAATVDECKSAAITPEKLYEVSQTVEGEAADKFGDLALICGAYDALCARQGADPRDKLTKLAAALEECPWAEGRDIYIDCFTDFTAQERKVLEQLLRQAHSVTVALTCDKLTEGEEDVFSPARRTALGLLSLAKKAGVTAEVETRLTPPAPVAQGIGEIERHLFAPVIPVQKGIPAGVELYRASSPFAEVERCAAALRQLIREGGIRCRELAVTARSMETYGPLIDLIFPRYGLSVFLARMDDVLQKPILTLVTAALDAVAEDYAYEDMFRYLKTALAGLTPDETDRLENYALKWDIRGQRWAQKADWAMHPQGYGLDWKEEDREEVRELDGLRRKVIAPLEKLRKTEEKTGKGLSLALYAFLEEIGLPQRLTARAGELRERGDAGLAAEYQQLWEILCAGLEQCADLLGEMPMEWEEFGRLFKLVLSQYEVGVIPVSLDRITAGEMPRLAHKRCKVLYILGADDGQIPAVAPSPGLLQDEDRIVLAQYGLESAPKLTDKLWREMTIIYETCALPSDRLIVSYPASGADGGERRGSFLVKKLRTLFPDLPLREEESGGGFRLSAPRPALEFALQRPEVGRVLGEIPGYVPLLERMERSTHLERGRLTRPAVDLLYGKRVPMSASRMDKYKSCHFSYFMQYGLAAKPRKKAGFAATDYGTFVHYVLEHILQERKEGQAPTRAEVSAIVARYVEEKLGGLEGETARFRYLFARLEKTVYAVVKNVCEELDRSDFKPIAFELGFGVKDAPLPPVELTVDGVTVSVTGLVDRVDGWEKDGKLYLRVVDYKTGRKSFNFTDLWNGLGLQMLLYLFTLQEKGKSVFGDKEIVPAGVLYLPAREEPVAGSRSMTDQARQQAVDKQLTRQGLVLDNADVLSAMEHSGEGFRFLPLRVKTSGEITGEALVSAERLGKLERHTRQILESIAQELAAGKIAADPFWEGEDRNACKWCEYAAACQFREGSGDDHRRWLSGVKAEEFWSRLDSFDRQGRV